MKKIVISIILIVVFAILLIPSKIRIKDGGSIQYKAVLYEYTKLHSLDINGYIDGCRLKILGFEVYEKTKLVLFEEKE